MPGMVDEAVRRELALTGDEGLADEAEAAARAPLERRYPEPTEGDIAEFHDRNRRLFNDWRTAAFAYRDVRYQRDTLPKKWQRDLKDGRRFYSRLGHNEINRRVSSQLRNRPQITVLPIQEDRGARDKAAHETRWLNALPKWLEDGSPDLRSQTVDCLYDCGQAAFEIYLTDAYDDIDTAPRMITDGDTEREETPREILKRTREYMTGRRPFGMRYVDGVNVYVERDEDGTLCRGLVVERKPRKQVWNALRRHGSTLSETDLSNPDAHGGQWAWPENDPMGAHGLDTVTTARYYDPVWYAYLVDGKVVDGPKRHGMPGVPLIVGHYRRTSASQVADSIEGAIWGMAGMEVWVNDIMTLASDVQFTFSRPKFAIEADKDGVIDGDPKTGEPRVFDVSGSNGVPQLPPGARLVNVLQGFTPMLQAPLLQFVMGLYGKSSVNPVAHGESPGASPAGYTVSALTSNAEEVDLTAVEAEARMWGEACDYIRRLIRDTIRDTVYLTASLGDATMGGQAQWLGLSPPQITEAPCIATIDPTSDSNRLAKRQSLEEGQGKGFTSRQRVQREGYQIQDTDAEDKQIAVEFAKKEMLPKIVEMAMQWVQLAIETEMGGGPGPGGGQSPPGPSGPGIPGVPAEPQPPTVGAAMSAMSQPEPISDGGAMNAATQNAGQGSNYIPPPVRQ